MSSQQQHCRDYRGQTEASWRITSEQNNLLQNTTVRKAVDYQLIKRIKNNLRILKDKVLRAETINNDSYQKLQQKLSAAISAEVMNLDHVFSNY